MVERIQEIVDELIVKCGTIKPSEICDLLGIEMINEELPKETNGFFVNIEGHFVIVLNTELNDTTKRKVVAHELGHIVLHNDLNIERLKSDTLMYPPKYEKQADIFAAILLLKDKTELNDSESINKEYIAKSIGIACDVVDMCI